MLYLFLTSHTVTSWQCALRPTQSQPSPISTHCDCQQGVSGRAVFTVDIDRKSDVESHLLKKMYLHQRPNAIFGPNMGWETRVEIGRDRRTAQSQVSQLFVVRGKTMISARTKMESLLELLVQDSKSTGREEASSAFDSRFVVAVPAQNLLLQIPWLFHLMDRRRRLFFTFNALSILTYIISRRSSARWRDHWGQTQESEASTRAWRCHWGCEHCLPNIRRRFFS